MNKPHTFQQACIATRNLPYLNVEDTARANVSNGGVIGTGQVVWLEAAAANKLGSPSATAFIEEIGVVSIDSRWLARTDLAKGGPAKGAELIAELSAELSLSAEFSLATELALAEPVHGAVISAAQPPRR